MSAVCLVAVLFSSVMVVGQTYAASAVTLTVTVDKILTFALDTDPAGTVAFGTITPGTAYNATTTLLATTNDTSGWLVTLSGDNKTSANKNLKCISGGCVVGTDQITDQAEWIPGAATTTVGTNTATIANLDNSGNVLAFRVMSASSTNGGPFLATSWWGTTDCYLTTATTCFWAGIASSTVARTIGNAGAGSYSATVHINTVQYYLKVATTQPSGAYTAPLTYTGTVN